MNKTCLIKQPAGLGDIFFCQKIAYHYKDLGYRIIWPVSDSFGYLSDYLDAFEYPLVSEDFEYKNIWLKNESIFNKELVLLILDGATKSVSEKHWMKAKYQLAKVDPVNWLSYFNLKRNKKIENKLYFDVLKLSENDKYILKNNMFGSPPNYLIKDLNIKSDIKKHVQLEFIDGFNIFDWCKVIENAEEIWTVDTSINYIMEKLKLKAKKLEIFSRYNPPNWFIVDYVCKLNYHKN